MFHISDSWDFSEGVISPRICQRVPDEPEMARICVAPTVEQCILAIGHWEDYFSSGKEFRIYKTEEETTTAIDIIDSHLTGERWLTKPSLFKYVRTIKELEINALPKFEIEWLFSIRRLENDCQKILKEIRGAITSK